MADTVYKEIVKVYNTMKFVKCISLFFIYPAAMFGLGFASNMAIQEFFYPGIHQEQESTQKDENLQKVQKADEPVLETGYLEEPVISADTNYVVLNYDAVTGETVETEEITPDKYIGLTRQKLEEELKEYGQSPSLTDLEKGFEYIELLSFSPARVVIRKSYEKEEEGFFLINEDHYVVVYDKSLAHIYMNTGIRTEDLPQVLQDEIMRMKYIETENELYNFLESYSS